MPDHEQKQAALSYLNEAWAEARHEGVDGDEESGGSSLRDEIDSLGRSRARADREADAARRLDELKRRMGK